MRVKGIENNQSFSGRVIFVKEHANSYKYTDRIEKYFPKTVKKQLTDVKSLIEDLPFDLYVSRNAKYPEFYEFNANTSHFNILKNKTNSKTRPVFVHENVLESSLFNGAKDAIKNFIELTTAKI